MMKRVLYISNIEVPYRVAFFNQLAEKCDLTVLYERNKSSNRDALWTSSVKLHFHKEYLNGKDVGNENSFSFDIIKVINRGWDAIIIGCYNSYVQMMAVLYMRYNRIPFIISLDGEPFIGNGIKGLLKKFFLKGASAYLTAGRESANNLKKVLGEKSKVYPYYFSSLTDEEIKTMGTETVERDRYVLVVGQYFEYKGMDVAFKVADLNHKIRYKFVGMGSRTEMFITEMGQIPENIEVVPFLQKYELEKEYQHCSMLLLPSRQECWGLVVNEAAAFGTPIVSTWGSGAAQEFLGEKYSGYLAEPGDAKSLLACVEKCYYADNTEYSKYLQEKSRYYSIEKSVEEHMQAINSLIY